MGIIGQAAGVGLGMATAGWQDKRQIKQQKKLQSMQIEGSKEMGKYNQELALDTWDKTNYDAQRKQMEKAGLNVGLMYGGGGAGGGTTSGGGGGAVSGGTAAGGSGEIGMGMQIGLQTQMMQAQIEATNAAAEKTKAETKKLEGVDTEKTGTEIENLKQTTTNAKLQAGIMEYDKTLKEIEANVAGKTQDEIIQQIRTATEKLKAETISAATQGEIDVATKENVIKGIDLANQATTQGITASKAGVKATEAGIEKTKQETENLALEEINKVLENEMKANGITSTDPAIVRIASRVMHNMGVTLKSAGQKMSRVIGWMKGENGEQTMERLEQILKE